MKQFTCQEEEKGMLAILSETPNLHKRNRRIGASSPAISDFCFIKAEVYPWMVPERDKQQRWAYTSDQFSLPADLHCFAQILFTSFSVQHKMQTKYKKRIKRSSFH